MGNASVKTRKNYGRRRSQHFKRNNYKRSHRHRRYRGGVNPSRLGQTVVNANPSGEPPVPSPPKTRKLQKKVREMLKTRKVKNPTVSAFVTAAELTRGDVEDARNREALSKSPSQKRSDKELLRAKAKADMYAMAVSRKAREESDKKKREEEKRNKLSGDSMFGNSQRFGSSSKLAPMLPFVEEEPMPSPNPPVKKMSAAEIKKMRDAVKKAEAEMKKAASGEKASWESFEEE
jgi:hypothetical protein